VVFKARDGITELRHTAVLVKKFQEGKADRIAGFRIGPAGKSIVDVQNAGAGETKEVKQESTAQTLTLDLSASSLKWIGTKVTGKHNGTVAIKEGSLSVKDGQLTGGSFVLDMEKIVVEDLKAGQGKEKLEAHLKSKDFFKVDSFPKGEFELTEVSGADSAATIKGNLTLLGVTKGVSFPAKITYNDGGKAVKANAKFEIDRTDWHIVYGNDKSLKDKFIHPKIEIELELVSAQ